MQVNKSDQLDAIFKDIEVSLSKVRSSQEQVLEDIGVEV